ncbi:hypothetical protein AXX12_16555 [Anaerosporomusa subterranea]|uniref:Uncharacterized protein n=1 Tax=Anaerosporomusa subterranea TaxID=1794912 RepID=A0A154BLQ1_ANASB|nr:hypothetical protein [Anaerosporomusa subterranea]KYZ74831.1 hypothetical protein AXX12_16555 [Anaerosporomusa subterranea]MDF2501676.1 hypothetical protein [Anaerosporomusa subterranea]
MRKLSFLVVLTCFLVTFSGTAFAWSDRSEDRPYLAHFGAPSLSIWHDRNDEFHVKSTNLRGQHIFTGVIQTDGRFYDIDEKNMENGDFVRLDRDRNSIRFRLTGRGFDEFNFKVRRGDTLKFDLNKDGRDMPRKQIFIGKDGWHPGDNRFTLR